jgi:hypothetical protein
MAHLRMSSAKAPVVRAPRYKVRSTNGVHHVIDTFTYGVVDFSYHEQEALEMAKKWNEEDAVKRRP